MEKITNASVISRATAVDNSKTKERFEGLLKDPPPGHEISQKDVIF